MSASGEEFGLGLLPEHYVNFIERRPAMNWLEIISENYIQACVDGSPFAELGVLAERHCGEAPAARLAGPLRLWIESGLLLAHNA